MLGLKETSMTRTFASALVLVVIAACEAAGADAPLEFVGTIRLKGVEGKLDHLAVDVGGQRLFVANKPNNTLDIVELKTGTLVKQIPNQGKVSGVAYAPDLDMVYVGNGAGVCNGFAGADYKLVFSTKVPGADNVHYHNGNRRLYVAHGETLSSLDAKSGKVLSALPLPGSIHGFVLDEAAGQAFAVVTKPSAIAIIDLAKNQVTSTIPLTLSDAGSPIAHDPARGLLYVGCPKKAMVVVFDARTRKELTGIAISGGIDDIHFDAERNRIYASCGDRALVTIASKNGSYVIVGRVETPQFSRTCAWSAGKLYLGVPRQAGQEGPEVRVFQARP
jgi:DNA-binding beta-propeller fold protein YncE